MRKSRSCRAHPDFSEAGLHRLCMTEKERNLLYGVVSLILPENILDQFDIVRLEDEDIARNEGTYQPFGA